MELSTTVKDAITKYWQNYQSNKVVVDNKGIEHDDIDAKRLIAIADIKDMISQFVDGAIDIYEFKTTLDGYNKRNNLWGFTATKGQMFFNQLVKNSSETIDQLELLVRGVITEPKDLDDALLKIERLESYTTAIFTQAADKRKVPNPGSIGYFLSYFWQIHAPYTWPIMYTSLIQSFEKLDLWNQKGTQVEQYRYFYELNTEIKQYLIGISGEGRVFWEVEHTFWNATEVKPHEKSKKQSSESLISVVESVESEQVDALPLKANINLEEYLIPKVASLVELGAAEDLTSARKGSDYEKMVAEVFRQLDFEVEELGQGKGREPDAIIKCREENIAFIVDAKAYSNGYVMRRDDRALREYINYHCPKLRKEGYKKIGFIIVSNSFKQDEDLRKFMNEMTWETDIKRFLLITSEALLYLLAYKTKNRDRLQDTIDVMVGFGDLITVEGVVSGVDDV